MATGSGDDAFAALAEACDEVVFVTDYSMRMLYASRRFEETTGFTAADFQFPQADNPFIHREDAEYVAQVLTRFVSSDERVSDPVVNRFLDRWGNGHRVRTVVTKTVFASQDALLFVCRLLEMPPPDAADVRQYRALVDTIDDAVVRLDNGGRFLFTNRRAHEILGYSAVELGRLRLDDIVVSRDLLTFTTELAKAVGSPRPSRFELRLTGNGGRIVRVQATLTSLGPFGQTGELLAVFRPLPDVTDAA